MAVRPVSVIICTHNRAQMLARIVRQIGAQRYPGNAFEIVVVDNASTDNTCQTVRQLAAEIDVPVRYVWEPGQGITLVRNRGGVEASLPYLAYIDDDCTIGPDWLKKLMSGFDLDERVVAVGGLVVPEWDEPRPSWLGPDMNPWLADTHFLGTRPRLLGDDERLVEANTVMERRAWQAAHGFVGMEQFGSRNAASSEIRYLLYQLRRQGGKAAYVPQAIACHHIGAPQRGQMLRRAYWQGVSDAVLEYLLHRHSRAAAGYAIGLNIAALVALFSCSAAAFARLNSARGMYHLMRTARRAGLVLGELRLVGDWQRARRWVAQQQAPSQVPVQALL